MSLDGTIKTPIGPVPKKVALGVGGAAIVIGGIVWYRQKQAASSASAVASPEQINPATGYAYGSPEDAAAMQEQAAYVTPSNNSGSTGSSNTPVTVTNNSEWTQAVLAYYQDQGNDPAAMSAALGKYISGAYIVPGSAEESLVHQATAIEGLPPGAGSQGYPPNINTTPPAGPVTTPPTTTTPPAATGNAGPITGRVTTATSTSINVKFTGAANAVQYIVYLDGKVYKTITGSPFSVGALKPNSHHTVGVQAVAANGSKGPISNTTLYTKK